MSADRQPRGDWPRGEGLIVSDALDPIAKRAFYEALFPNAAEKKAKSVQSTIDWCIRLIEQGEDSYYGVGPWYFEQARKQIAERDGQLTECRGDPLLKRGAA